MYPFIAPLAEPVGAIWCLMALGLVWLLCRRQWRCTLWLGIPTVLLFLIGSTPVVEMLVAREEQQWASVRLATRNAQPADAVIALGGGQRTSQEDVLGFAMDEPGSRILTAIELVRTGKARILVLGGSHPMPNKPDEPSITVVQDWVTSWGLVEGAVTNLGICFNTHDEAVAFKKLQDSQGWSKVVLVTSALHMRRSFAVFRKQGIEVTPVAADFQVAGVSQDMPFSPFPRQIRFMLLALYLHEKIGWWAYRMRGWV